MTIMNEWLNHVEHQAVRKLEDCAGPSPECLARWEDDGGRAAPQKLERHLEEILIRGTFVQMDTRHHRVVEASGLRAA
ncbi:MAG: hypothetical protein CMH69_14210 [Nitratireductor sp.]|jgi:hypothetical protein|nr:hypothetical protein [Nitratireductor sp.]